MHDLLQRSKNQARNFFRVGLIVFIASCKVAPMYLRYNQVLNEGKTDGIIRIYIDKRGAIYPSVNVPIDSDRFKNQHFLRSVLKNPYASNLSWYFTSNMQRLIVLRRAYQVLASGSPKQDFEAVQNKIIDEYVRAIQQEIARQHATTVIFFIHGFNEPHPEDDGNYPTLQRALLLNHDAANRHPVFVELYWDGLYAYHSSALSEAKIWPYAEYNSRWVGLSLRNLINRLEDQHPMPVTIVTHSLGASVATGALFNNTTKWDDTKIDSLSARRIKELMKIPTPTVEVRLGMIAPAIPGQPTFADFNKRSPTDITAQKNNITHIAIAYDPFDFATSKDVFKIVSLAPFDGSTTLGCDYYWKSIRTTDIELVKDTLRALGYNTERLLYPTRFNTGVRPKSGGNHEHFMQYYMQDTVHAKQFFEDLFK